ncbi:MAG: hypothetical protein M3Z04_21080 [Chloroflexota bacterium]|nr:hypothetical protein [Chloroflexota bacterium]
MITRTDTDDAQWITTGLDLGGRFRVTGALDRSAIGNWATVVAAESLDPAATGGERHVALKIMRGRHLGKPAVYGQFALEARLLRDWYGLGSAAGLLAAGYLRDPAYGAQRVDPDGVVLHSEADAFAAEADLRCAGDWRPFLVLSVVPFTATLLHRLRQLHGPHTLALNAVVPLAEAVTITIAGLDLLDACHSEQVYYRDHKPEHVIWRDGRFEFLDWNGGEWVRGPLRGSLPQSEAQLDIQNFIGYAVYPLYTGCAIDGAAIRPTQRSTPHPPPPTSMSDGDHLPFYGAEAWLPADLRSILSRPFWSPMRRYNTAGGMAADLRAFLQNWRVAGLATRLDRVLDEVAAAQAHLRQAQRSMNTLVRLADQPRNASLTISSEIRRLQRHLQRMVDGQLFPGEGSDP